MTTTATHRTIGALVAAVAVGAVVMVTSMTSAVAATLPTITRAPYVTDLFTSQKSPYTASAYVNWAVKGSTSTAGSVVVVPRTGSTCPASIPWSSSAIKAPTSIPLNEGDSTTASWKFTVESTTEYQESVPVPGLSASTTYCYAVFPTDTSSSKAQLWPTQSFTTLDPPTSSAPLSFDVIADTGENTSGFNQGESNIYSEIAGSGARFLVVGGDVGYSDGSQNSYGDLNQTGSEVSNIFGPQYFPLAKGIPTYVADGNHGQNVNDLRIWPEPHSVTGSGGTYALNPPATNVDNVGTTTSYPQDWYAIQSGDVRVYVLDASWQDSTSYLKTKAATGAKCGSNAAACQGYQIDADEHWQTTSPEYQWLKADLAAHPGGVKMAVFHYPLRSDNATQPSDPYESGLESLLAANGAQIAFNGHAHTYQRIQPKASGTIANFVTGGGGGTLEPVLGGSTCTALQQTETIYALGWASGGGSSCGAPKPGSTLNVYNFLKVTVTGTTVLVQAFDGTKSGTPFDQATFTYGAPDTHTPTVPTGLAGKATSATSVGLTWKPSTDNVGVAGYDIYRNGALLGTSPTTNYTDYTAAASNTYQYSVAAYDAADNTSGPSTAVPVTTPAGPPPGAPALVQSASSSTGVVSLAATGTGDLLVLSASLYTGATNHITAVTDSAGDTWHPIGNGFVSGHNSEGELWYTFSTAPSTSVVVTTKASSEALEVQEFSGVGALDTSGFAAGDTAAATTSSTPVASGDLAVGFVAGHGSGQAITLSPGYAAQPQVTSGTTATLVTGAQVVGSGAQAFGGTFAAGMYWAAGLALFTPA